ncbi:MAG: D-tyrosyl-tRNA(Tyr) deacylase [Ruminococcaceae bacterium]|nr:D-tyrosyl-tRNA(Tyr) deacylase [Oscillospiraceae bacterium]
MRAVVQRVTHASVTIDGQLHSEIQKGFLVLLGIHKQDTREQAEALCKKIAGLRVFEDENGRMNLSLDQVGGEILLVSQFTLYGDCSHGYRPSFMEAARPDTAVPLYELCGAILRGTLGADKIKTGVFGADMAVDLTNDGPVTIIMDTDTL